jgi:hypothetical protein
MKADAGQKITIPPKRRTSARRLRQLHWSKSGEQSSAGHESWEMVRVSPIRSQVPADSHHIPNRGRTVKWGGRKSHEGRRG